MDCDAPLPVGQEVSAKFRGAFCEAVVRSSSNDVQVHINFTDKSVSSRVVPLRELRGNVVLGGLVQGPTGSARGQFDDCVITRIVDRSVYEVEFDDGDLKNLKRNNIRPKGRAYFTNDTTIESLPLMDPEKFAALPLRASRRKGPNSPMHPGFYDEGSLTPKSPSRVARKEKHVVSRTSERGTSAVAPTARHRSRTVSASGALSDTKSKGRPRTSMTAPNSLSNLKAQVVSKASEGFAVSRTGSVANVGTEAFKLRTTRLAGMAVFVEPLSNHSAPYWHTAMVVPFACVDPIAMGVDSVGSNSCVVRYFRDGKYGTVPEACLRRFSTEIPLFRLFSKQSRGFQSEPEIEAAIDFLETNKLGVSLQWPSYVPLKKRQADYQSDSDESEDSKSDDSDNDSSPSDVGGEQSRKTAGRKRRTESMSSTRVKKQCLDAEHRTDDEDEGDNEEESKSRVRRRKVPRRVSISAGAVDIEAGTKKGCRPRGPTDRPVTPTPLEMEALYTNQWKFRKHEHVWAMSYVDGRVYEAKVTDRKLMSNARDGRRQQRAQASNSYRNQPTPHYKIHYIKWSTDRYDEWIQEEHVFDTNPDARPAVRARKPEKRARAESVSSAASDESTKDTDASSSKARSETVSHDCAGERSDEADDADDASAEAGEHDCTTESADAKHRNIQEASETETGGKESSAVRGRKALKERKPKQDVEAGLSTLEVPSQPDQVASETEIIEGLDTTEPEVHIADKTNDDNAQAVLKSQVDVLSMDEESLSVRTPSRRRKRKFSEGTREVQDKPTSSAKKAVVTKEVNNPKTSNDTISETISVRDVESADTEAPGKAENSKLCPVVDDKLRSVTKRPRGRKGRKRGPRKMSIAMDAVSTNFTRTLSEPVAAIDTEGSEVGVVDRSETGITRKRTRSMSDHQGTAVPTSTFKYTESGSLGAPSSDKTDSGKNEEIEVSSSASKLSVKDNVIGDAVENVDDAESSVSLSNGGPGDTALTAIDTKRSTSPVIAKPEPVPAGLGGADSSNICSVSDTENLLAKTARVQTGAQAATDASARLSGSLVTDDNAATVKSQSENHEASDTKGLQEPEAPVESQTRNTAATRKADPAADEGDQKGDECISGTASQETRSETSESDQGCKTDGNGDKQDASCKNDGRRSRDEAKAAQKGQTCADGSAEKGDSKDSNGASGSSYTVYTSTTTHKQEMGDGMTLTKEEFKVRHTLDTGGITISNQQIHEVKHTVEKSTIHPNLQWTADGGLEMSTLEERMRQLKQQYLAHKAELARRERVKRMKKESMMNANGHGTPSEMNGGLPSGNSEEQNDQSSGGVHPKVETNITESARGIGTR